MSRMSRINYLPHRVFGWNGSGEKYIVEFCSPLEKREVAVGDQRRNIRDTGLRIDEYHLRKINNLHPTLKTPKRTLEVALE